MRDGHVIHLTSRVQEVLSNGRLMAPGERVAVGVSGGLDSVVLLHVLARLSKSHGWSLTVLHFNHRLRGRESAGDERFVQNLARSNGLECRVGRGDVRTLARRKQLSVEMAARELRHTFLARSAVRLKCAKIFLAHHADDQVELFFLRLFRGAGSEGLGGMRLCAPSPSDARVMLIRPFLGIARADLERYARDEGLDYRNDSTNAELDYDRNRIRHELLPLLRAEYQPALHQTVSRVMEILRAESDFLGQHARELQERVEVRFDELPIAIQRRWLIQEFEKLRLAPSFEWIERIRLKAEEPWMVRPGLVLWRDGAGRIRKRSEAPVEFQGAELCLEVAADQGRATFAGLSLKWKQTPFGLTVRPARRQNREVFDADRVGNQVRLRHWRPGDRFQPIGMKSPVKLQDLFTNARIPAGPRRQAVLAESLNGYIFWVEGLRISEQAKVDASTVRSLNWEWRRS